MPWDIAGEQIEKAMAQGDFDNLPGAGKPFKFEDESGVPEEWRLAYRIMRDNDLKPEWIDLRKEIEQDIQNTREKLRRAAQTCHTEAKKIPAENVLKQLEVKQIWRNAQAEYRKQVEEINQKIKNYNLKVPDASLTRDLLDAEREIARFER